MKRKRSAKKKPVGHPSGDVRYKNIDTALKRSKYQKDSLLEILNIAQGTFGYLSEDLLIYIATQLELPLIRVYSVATFYHLFTFSPLGKHNCIVCTGTACHVKGADSIVQTISGAFNIQTEETTPDGILSLTTARCIGSCGLAPVAVLDGKVRGRETSEGLLSQIKELITESEGEQAEGSAA